MPTPSVLALQLIATSIHVPYLQTQQHTPNCMDSHPKRGTVTVSQGPEVAQQLECQATAVYYEPTSEPNQAPQHPAPQVAPSSAHTSVRLESHACQVGAAPGPITHFSDDNPHGFIHQQSVRSPPTVMGKPCAIAQPLGSVSRSNKSCACYQPM
jgi:hypothetical protein